MQACGKGGNSLGLGEVAQGNSHIAQVAAAFGAEDGGVPESFAEGQVVKL